MIQEARQAFDVHPRALIRRARSISIMAPPSWHEGYGQGGRHVLPSAVHVMAAL